MRLIFFFFFIPDSIFLFLLFTCTCFSPFSLFLIIPPSYEFFIIFYSSLSFAFPSLFLLLFHRSYLFFYKHVSPPLPPPSLPYSRFLFPFNPFFSNHSTSSNLLLLLFFHLLLFSSFFSPPLPHSVLLLLFLILLIILRRPLPCLTFF